MRLSEQQAQRLMNIYQEKIDENPNDIKFWQGLYDSAKRDFEKAINPRAWQDAKAHFSGMQFQRQTGDKHLANIARYLRGIDRLIAAHAPIGKRLESSGKKPAHITGMEPALSTESRRVRWERMVGDAIISIRKKYDPYLHEDMHRIASVIREVYVKIWREVNPEVFVVDESSVDPDNPGTYQPKWYRDAIGARAGGSSQLQELWYQDTIDHREMLDNTI